ncbi:ornithine carbamoyltransferase [Paenibacillus senegalensis]|uniref:ornithine carbamoyltransferase n=1 Tax=Paenibacillus senegalensis TaxID=1465766 RepID=UPI0002899E8F|nr:ornithine carbamoyltransferase [Paenibacillus senegalensis]
MHFLDIKELSSQQLNEIFHLTDQLKAGRRNDSLVGKTFILFFPESSLRTRTTFEKGIRELGGECILFPPESLDKREKLSDVAAYLANWADGIIVRHPDFTKISELSAHSPIPVLNAMSSYNHPCEIISDLYSIRALRDNYKNLVYTFVGPAGNICRSWADAASVLKLEFHHVCAAGYELFTTSSLANRLAEDSAHYRFHTELEDVLMRSDVVLTDALPEPLRNKKYIDQYQITLQRMRRTREHSILNPCPPFFRGEEVSEDAISSDYFAGYAFKKNLLYVQQAILLYCLAH